MCGAASDVPMSTGTIAAERVLGRAARNQLFMVARSRRHAVAHLRLHSYAVARLRGETEQPSSRKPLELAKIRLPLLDERVASFLRFLGQVVQQRRAAD